MATGREWREGIAEATGVPERTLIHIERRLGESGMLPRGPRGRNAPHFDAIHGALFLLGTMSIADGIGSTAARVIQAVNQLGALNVNQLGALTVDYDIRIARFSGRSWDQTLEIGGEPSFLATPKGRFDLALAYILDNIAHPQHGHLFQQIRGIGIEWGRDAVFGWIMPGPNVVDPAVGRPDPKATPEDVWVFFAKEHTGAEEFTRRLLEPAGLVREVRLSNQALCELGQLIDHSEDAHHQEAHRG